LTCFVLGKFLRSPEGETKLVTLVIYW
jgi:hypothetical protein